MKSMFNKLVVVALLIVVSIASACALRGKTRGVVVAGNVGLAEALFGVQDEADRQVKAQEITEVQRREISAWLLPALETGRRVNTLVATWPKGDPAPPELATLVQQINALVSDGLRAWPDSPAKSKLVTKISIAQSAVMALLLIFAQN